MPYDDEENPRDHTADPEEAEIPFDEQLSKLQIIVERVLGRGAWFVLLFAAIGAGINLVTGVTRSGSLNATW